MQFVKKNAVMLGSGVVALIALTLLIVGMMDTSVRDAMQRRISDASAIGSLRSDPKNQAIIDAEAARVKAAKGELKRTTEELDRINKRAPLLAEVFPKPLSGAKSFEFKEAYGNALAKLLRDLSAGDLPTQAEEDEEQQNVSDLQQTEQMNQAEGGEPPPDRPPPPPAGGPRGRPGVAPPSGGPVVGGPAVPGGPVRPGVPPTTSAPQAGQPPPLDPTDIKYDARRRATAAKAKVIRIWANEWAIAHSPILEMQTAPAVADMWLAQVALWVETDVVNAIKQLNDEGAAKSPSGEGSIETSPIKRLERIRVYGYVGPDGKIIEFPVTTPQEGKGVGGGLMPSVSEIRPSFTLKKPDEQFDVVRFTVHAVIDQRDLNAFIDRICKQNFYVCTYVEIGQPDTMAGYVYGTDPVMRVVLDFEGYLSRKAYATNMMPPDVAKALGIAPPGGNP